MINYAKLWLLLNSRGMKRTDLLKILSSPTLAKLGKNENVSVEIIGKICDFLDCQPGDIMENVKREDIIKAGEIINKKIGEFMDVLTTTTRMTPEALFEEFMKEAPTMFENIKNGNKDFIGLQAFIEKPDEERA